MKRCFSATTCISCKLLSRTSKAQMRAMNIESPPRYFSTRCSQHSSINDWHLSALIASFSTHRSTQQLHKTCKLRGLEPSFFAFHYRGYHSAGSSKLHSNHTPPFRWREQRLVHAIKFVGPSGTSLLEYYHGGLVECWPPLPREGMTSWGWKCNRERDYYKLNKCKRNIYQ